MNANDLIKKFGEELSKHVDVLLIVNDDDTKYRSGTISLIKYQDHFFGISTVHQLKAVPDTSKVVIGLMNLKDGATTSSEARKISHPIFSDGSRADLAVFDFTEAVGSEYVNGGRFFEIDSIIQEESDAKGTFVGFLALGYAYQDTSLDISEEDFVSWVNIKAGMRCVYCKFLESSSNDLDLESFKAVAVNEFDPDGMSGGMMVGLFVNSELIIPVLQGMILMAGNGYYHVLTARSILTSLDQW